MKLIYAMGITSRFFTGFLILSMLSCGCSSTRFRPKIAGKVTLRGSSVGEQTLALVWDGPKEEFFVQKLFILPDGTFAGDVPQSGIYKVAIELPRAAQEGATVAGSQTIPRKFRDPATSNLTWEIKDGVNQRDFDLEE